MALWLVRTGKHGEFENKFLESNRIYICWTQLNRDLGKLKSKKDLTSVLEEVYPQSAKGKIRNNTGQIWCFVSKMQQGDWVVVPSKVKSTLNFGEITGDYTFDTKADDPCYHSRKVKWIAKDVPRTLFDQDILYSFGAFMTICQVQRNDAEKRIHAIAKSGWKLKSTIISSTLDIEGEASEVQSDIEQLGKDQIAKIISQKFKGHNLTNLIEGILKVQGYTTHISPEGPDKGVDILASPGPLGFGRPRICVQVKSGDEKIDRPTLDQLIGTMHNFKAEQGLLVSWGGFKKSVTKELPAQFFQVRLWDRDDIIRELLNHYDQLDQDLRAELPLKQIWTVTPQEQDDGPAYNT